jgi:hypothetical protein
MRPESRAPTSAPAKRSAGVTRRMARLSHAAWVPRRQTKIGFNSKSAGRAEPPQQRGRCRFSIGRNSLTPEACSKSPNASPRGEANASTSNQLILSSEPEHTLRWRFKADNLAIVSTRIGSVGWTFQRHSRQNQCTIRDHHESLGRSRQSLQDPVRDSAELCLATWPGVPTSALR